MGKLSKKLKQIFFFTACLLCLNLSVRVSAEQLVIDDLTEEWSVYDVRLEGFVPYLPDIHRNVKSIYMPISLEQYRGNLLCISSIQEGHLYLNNQLIKLIEAGESIYLPVDSLFSHNGSSESELVQIAVFAPNVFNEIPTLKIVNGRNNYTSIVGGNVIFSPKERPLSTGYEFVVLLSLGILFVFSVVLQKSGSFSSISEFGSVFARLLKSRFQSEKYSLASILYFISFFSISYTFLLVVLRQHSDLFREEALLFRAYIGDSLVMISFQLFIIVSVFLIFKFLIIRVLTSLYGFSGLGEVHTYEFIAFTQFFTTIVLMIGVLLNVSPFELSFQVLIGILFTGVFFKSILVALRINRLLSFKKVYLFSYFCITEFIPILFVLKFFINITNL